MKRVFIGLFKICSNNRELSVNRTMLYINWLQNLKMYGIIHRVSTLTLRVPENLRYRTGGLYEI